jgi:hypothetical protein
MDDGTQIKYLKGRDFTYEIYQPAVGVDPKTAGKIDHVAFVSENLEGDYKECMKRGYKDTTGGIQAIPGVRYFKFLNVTGEEVEFCQAI